VSPTPFRGPWRGRHADGNGRLPEPPVRICPADLRAPARAASCRPAPGKFCSRLFVSS